MKLYRFMSVGYDLLDRIWFSDKGENPRNVIGQLIPDKQCKVLDMCCGTFSNGLPVARQNPKNRVVGVDRSKEMLKEARKKLKKEGLRNVRLLCKDATQTGWKEKSFDVVILGLVLHECTDELWKGILGEAHRLLKDDGRLIVLEWEKQERVSRKVKFAPLYAMEVMVNKKYFREFYYSDKREFFGRYQFEMIETHACNYSSVMVLKKSR